MVYPKCSMIFNFSVSSLHFSKCLSSYVLLLQFSRWKQASRIGVKCQNVPYNFGMVWAIKFKKKYVANWILENLPFGHKQTFWENSIEFFFAHLDKATIKPSCCEVSLLDMDDYI